MEDLQPQHRHYYSLNDDETLTDLGQHEDFCGAADAAPGNSLWLFDSESLVKLTENIKKVMEK